MTWFAVAYGALDLRAFPPSTEHSSELLILPTVPSVPLGISGSVASLWLRLLDHGLCETEMSSAELELVRDFERVGIASRDAAHPARITALKAPRLVAPMHELVYSLVGHLAREAGIKAVFIKGPLLHDQGLRAREHSGDVDVWVEPSRVGELSHALEDWGWDLLPEIWHGTEVNHSETLAPRIWGCEIDVHRRFPGSSLSDREEFREMERHTIPLEFAGFSFPVPQPQIHRIIFALHTIRPVFGRSTPQTSIDTAADVLKAGGYATFAAAHRLGATAALHLPLSQAFPQDAPFQEGPLPRNWTWLGKKTKLSGYFAALASVPFAMRPKIILRMFWPNRGVIMASDKLAGAQSKTTIQARWRRLSRGLSWAKFTRKSR